MDKRTLQEIEYKLNKRTNGFFLFKEIAGSAIGWGTRAADQGLEATDNIMPPKETEFQEGLNLIKLPKLGDSVIVYGVSEESEMSFLNGKTGVIILDYMAKEEKRVVVSFPNEFKSNHKHATISYVIPLKYLRTINNKNTEINEVSTYEESDWLAESHKKEIEKIDGWLKTTPEPYDDFHWNGTELLVIKDGNVIETINRKLLAEQNIISETRIIEENHKYEYGCLMALLNIPLWKNIVSIIKTDDLYTDEEGFGLEMEPHVTVLFGFHHKDVDITKLKQELLDISEIPVMVGGLSHFENENKPYDVVKFDVESELLRNLNKKLKKFPNTNEFEYNPHITIGYVKKGLGSKYSGKFQSTPTIIGKQLVYSHPSGKKDVWELPLKNDFMNSSDDFKIQHIEQM